MGGEGRETRRAFFGHHKCASRWILRVLKAAGRDMGLPVHAVGARETPELNGLAPGLLAYTNASGAQVARHGPGLRGFHVIRDPRDLVVSAYFSHLKSHETRGWPELVAQRARLQQLSKHEGLLATLDFVAPVLEAMAGWDYAHPGILELRFEAFTAAPYRSFLEAFAWLGLLRDDAEGLGERAARWVGRQAARVERRAGVRLPRGPGAGTISGERLLAIVYAHRFQKLAQGRARGQEDAGSHFRRGLPGDWRNHFAPEHVDAFKARFGELVSALGYEADEGWAAAVVGEGAAS